MNAKTSISAISAAAAIFCMTGCITEATHDIVDGEKMEATSRMNEENVKSVVRSVVEGVIQKSDRYKPVAGNKRVVNVKRTTIDTTSRGSQADYLAETIAASFEEELTNCGLFYIYDEGMAQRNAAAGRPVTVTPQFVMTSVLKEQNVRRDNGNFYREYSLIVKLIDAATNVQFWQKRVPLQKAVDKYRINQ